ncbi:PGF-CTERM sorting domain-containing protein [Methanocella sp. CWC-04]|uniref:PGF-CTERM sorting domain-containing protein n=1 Tax=Methanooceanicella nereidis TaxID=2052831 RepID=A0AAP2RH59_9EURY|nr:PGF-CTERM sorting domain-containing protein [Methanocella sp. CWC-04]MCD1296132.1 PGF-CTERM sorting domain-containing protein [Methanocella sp. CWC-04]
MKNTTKAALAALMIITMIAAIIPATAAYPFWEKAPLMPENNKNTGSVVGRVTTANSSVGLGYAYVAIVNAANVSKEYYNTTADANGYYQITGVNNTLFADGSLQTAYKVYANHSLFGEGWSNAFGVEPNSTASTGVVIFPLPAKIVLTAEKNHVLADNADHVTLSAYVTDALGMPVGDGFTINFEVLNATDAYGFLGNENSATSSGSKTLTATTKGGYAKVDFGWGNASGNSSIIEASFAQDADINDSIKIYFSPLVSSWFGSVVDSFNTGYGGIEVTLHVCMANATEIYNMTTITSSAQPYVGTYVFDNIVLTPDTAYAFATAEAPLTDNLTIYGASNNYSLNTTRTSAGFIVLHVPMPDEIRVTADPETILVGGDVSTITAQLYLNGLPYKRPGVKINFAADNDTVAYLPKVTTNLSDAFGKATIPLTSNETLGEVNVTANATITYNTIIEDSVLVKVVGWGTISGMVTDKNRNGVPNANVTLWYWNGTANNGIVKVPENPQLSNDGRTAAIGTYTYERIPWGTYNVTAEKDGHIYFAMVNLTKGTYTANVAIPDYVYVAPVTPTPTPVVTATATATPVPPTPTPTPTPTPGFETVFALAGLLGVAYLIARKEN